MSRANSSAPGRTGKRKLYHPHRPAKSEKADWHEKDPKNISPIVKSALRDAMKLERISSVEYDDFLWIIAQESGGIIDVRNSKSTARGLFQLLRAQYGLNPNGDKSFGNAIEECQGGHSLCHWTISFSRRRKEVLAAAPLVLICVRSCFYW